MKIRNEEVSIKIGNKEHKFTNLILNGYLDLFADSFLDFKNKDLTYCLVNFTHSNVGINENSTSMNYDLVLETYLEDEIEILTDRSITNKYYYDKEVSGGKNWSEFASRQIQDIGFAMYNSTTKKYIIYAYLNVANYNIIVQGNQPIIISRTDKIESDMSLWVSDATIKGPIHLTKRGIVKYMDNDYFTSKSVLYSIGFGVLPYAINKEYLAEDLTIQKSGTGVLEVQNTLETYYKKSNKFSNDLYMSDNLILQEPSYPFLIYKFKIYEETYPNPEQPAVWVDTGMYYTQYKKLTKHGKLSLKIKYERS